MQNGQSMANNQGKIRSEKPNNPLAGACLSHFGMDIRVQKSLTQIIKIIVIDLKTSIEKILLAFKIYPRIDPS